MDLGLAAGDGQARWTPPVAPGERQTPKPQTPNPVAKGLSQREGLATPEPA